MTETIVNQGDEATHATNPFANAPYIQTAAQGSLKVSSAKDELQNHEFNSKTGQLRINRHSAITPTSKTQSS